MHAIAYCNRNFICILANPYEPCDSFTNNLPILFRISCECYKYWRMPLQTLRMLANALRMKRLQSACLPILFLCNLFASIHRVNFFFVFEKDKYLSMPHCGRKGQGKAWPTPSLSQNYFQFQIFADKMHLLSKF